MGDEDVEGERVGSWVGLFIGLTRYGEVDWRVSIEAIS